MALNHRRLIRPGKKSGRFFLRSKSLLYKILPTNLSACKPTFYTIYTSHLRWNLGWIFIRKNDGVNVPAITKHPGNFSVEKDAKNVLRRKSHVCFNQEAARKTYTLSSQWLGSGLCMDSRFRFFSHWFPGSLMARFVASSDIFVLEFAIFIENPYLLPVYLLESDFTLAEVRPRWCPGLSFLVSSGWKTCPVAV